MGRQEHLIMANIPRPLISKYPGNQVAAGSASEDIVGPDPIPDGRTIRITCFGGALQKTGKVELQLRTQLLPTVKWRTLRCIVGPGQEHYENFQPIKGDVDGIAALRIVRTNDEPTNEKINAWVEGIRR
jgi:hypothetical protein